jgi:hypothetical protein
MRVVILLIIINFTACVPSPQVTESKSRSPASYDPDAPYIWGNKTFPKELRISENFATAEKSNITDMATAWKTVVYNKEFFSFGASVPNKADSVHPDKLLDSVFGIYKVTKWPKDIPDDALAVTQLFGRRYNVGEDNEYVRIEHADIMVNYQYRFKTTDAGDGFDLRTVILHELGHFLGLQHIDTREPKESSVMYPSITSSEIKIVPQTRDRDALADKYGITQALTASGMTGGSIEYRPRNNDPGKETRILIELKASGECQHKIDGTLVGRHQVKLK